MTRFIYVLPYVLIRNGTLGICGMVKSWQK